MMLYAPPPLQMAGAYKREIERDFPYPQKVVPFNVTTIYSQTSKARTRRDRQCEFDPWMGTSDTRSDNFQGSSHVLYVYHGHHIFIDQICQVHVTSVIYVNLPLCALELKL